MGLTSLPKSISASFRSRYARRCPLYDYQVTTRYIVAGGALSSDDKVWKPSGTGFYVPVEALSPIFRAKFKDEMKKTGLFEQIPDEVWRIDWNVNS
jgi:hypothetical protein